jgi:hypothetical protein
MGALIASGESVPLSAIEGVTAQQADVLAEHGINDIDALANTSVDDLVEFLDLSLDEAETILNAAKAVVAMRDKTLHGQPEETGELGVTGEPIEQHGVSAEFDATVEAGEVEPSSEMTAEGYDEAVESRGPFIAEPEILAKYSADPVALTEVEPYSPDEIVLQEPGRDLRPDTITPSPDITSTGAVAVERVNEIMEEESVEQLTASEEAAEVAAASQATAISPPEGRQDTASTGGSDEEKQDASSDAVE